MLRRRPTPRGELTSGVGPATAYDAGDIVEGCLAMLVCTAAERLADAGG